MFWRRRPLLFWREFGSIFSKRLQIQQDRSHRVPALNQTFRCTWISTTCRRFFASSRAVDWCCSYCLFGLLSMDKCYLLVLPVCIAATTCTRRHCFGGNCKSLQSCELDINITVTFFFLPPQLLQWRIRNLSLDGHSQEKNGNVANEYSIIKYNILLNN